MGDKGSVLVCGVDEMASAVARTLLLSGYAVALHERGPPALLRRRMAYGDAWFDGSATLGGVEARRVGNDGELLAGLRSGMFIPLLTLPRLADVARWPWDALVDARGPGADRAGLAMELVLVLGPGGCAGTDCDLVMEVGGADPGAVLRAGPAQGGPRRHGRAQDLVAAPVDGVFHSMRRIGETVPAGDMLGLVGTTLLAAPMEGRLRGLLRPGVAVRAGQPVAEIMGGAQVQVSGIDKTDAMIARAVEFALGLERDGLDPLPTRWRSA
ncbi:hypothetical protein [Xanthobacter sp. ZOL 2024]